MLVFLFVFHRIKHLKYCARTGAEEYMWSNQRESIRGMKKLHSVLVTESRWEVN